MSLIRNLKLVSSAGLKDNKPFQTAMMLTEKYVFIKERAAINGGICDEKKRNS